MKGRITLSTAFLRTLLAVIIIMVCVTLFPALGQASGSPSGYFSGDAYSTYGFTQAGPINAKLGRLTWLPCPCTGTNGQTKADSLPSLDASPILSTKTLYVSVYTNRGTTAATVKNTAETDGVNALGGLIKADKVLAVANTVADASTIKSTDSGSIFVNLKIAGGTISSNVSPNSKINLSGLGYVILRESTHTGDGQNRGGIIVNMLHIFVTTQNALGLPVGAQIILAHASSGFVRAPIQVQYSGVAYIASAKAVSPALAAQLGKVAPVYIGCMGTAGQTNSNSIASLSVAKILSLGAGKTTAFGGPQNGGVTAKTTATLKNLNLFNGMLKADALTAVATSTFQAGNGASSTDGSGFVNLTINGSPVLTVNANARVTLPGVGYVILYEVNQSTSTTGASTSVNMIHVFVTTSNSLGLPVGAEFVIVSANSGVRPF